MTARQQLALVAGLGNPGGRYAQTRHNAGFWFVDELARRYGGSFRAERKFQGELARIAVGGVECFLLKPMTLMNHSGRAIGELLRFYRLAPEQILVAHDDLDLPPGTARLKRGGGHGGHNGLRDTINVLGSREFPRLRLGIGHPGVGGDVVGYVLSRPTLDESAAINDGLTDAAELFPLLISGDWDRAVKQLHTRRKPDSQLADGSDGL